MNITDIIDFNESKNWEEAQSSGDNLNRYPIQFDSLWAGSYEITVVDDYGCEVIVEHSIGFDQSVFIPNVFTPNDDGYNDNFYIRNLPASGTQVIISNRSGSIVYRNDNYNYENLWDGGDVADGIYFYTISNAEWGDLQRLGREVARLQALGNFRFLTEIPSCRRCLRSRLCQVFELFQSSPHRQFP